MFRLFEQKWHQMVKQDVAKMKWQTVDRQTSDLRSGIKADLYPHLIKA